MLVPLTPENVGIFEPKPFAGAARLVRRLRRFLRNHLLEATVGALLVVWWLQVFAIWVGVLQDVTLLGGPLAG